MARWKRYVDDSAVGPARPQAGQFISGYREDYAVESGRLKLTPAKMGQTLRAADTGDSRALQEMFSALEEDPHVHSVMAKRKRRVLARPLEISAAVEDSPAAQEASDLCRRMVEGDSGEDGIAGWQEALAGLLSATGRGFALAQIVWVPGAPGDIRPARLELWPQRDCVLAGVGDSQYPDLAGEQIRILTDADQVRGEELARWQWVTHISKARQDGLAKAALYRIICWWWLFKHFAARDWVIYCERFGMPISVAKCPPDTNDSERDALLRTVMTIGKDGAAVVPEGSEIEFVEAMKGASQIPYDRLVEICDFQISKAILGGTLTTEAGDRGARSLGEVHERAETDIAEQDGRLLAETIRRDLLTPIVRFNLGANVPVPTCQFISGEQEDMRERAERDVLLATKVRLPMTKGYFYETYGITIPEEGDELVEPQAAAKAMGQGNEDEEPDTEPAPGDEDDDEDAETPTSHRPADALQLGSKKKSRAWAALMH